MLQILRGIQKYSKEIFPQQKGLFKQLATGQQPHTMMITCSDSRIDPNLITQTQPGDVFILRNAGNMVPAYGVSQGGEEASIEFAVEVLGVENIVVCGHTQCGAMAALSGKVDLKALPSIEKWLLHAKATQRKMEGKSPVVLDDYIEDNVLTQVQNLKTHPSIANGIAQKTLKIFGLVYRFEKGDAIIFDKQKQHFIEVRDFSNEDLISSFDLS
ncbi:MAG: carbonic anhydrase [Oligoflexales bacterium]